MALGSFLGTMKEGEANEEEDGRMNPESNRCCIKVANASLY